MHLIDDENAARKPLRSSPSFILLWDPELDSIAEITAFLDMIYMHRWGSLQSIKEGSQLHRADKLIPRKG
jgi:hypothetical protein